MVVMVKRERQGRCRKGDAVVTGERKQGEDVRMGLVRWLCSGCQFQARNMLSWARNSDGVLTGSTSDGSEGKMEHGEG